MTPYYTDDSVTLWHGDCLDVLASLASDSVDAVVTDPPYGLGFMGKAWDSTFTPGDSPMRRHAALDAVNAGASRQGGRQRASEDYQRRQARDARSYGEWCERWAAECLRVLKPGGHLLAFGGTRTAHRLASGIEDAGFEIRDTIAWLYGSGFPKSLDVSKAIDKAGRGVPQGAADPTSPNHGKYRTTTTEGKRWDGDSGQGYGAGGSRFLADGMADGSATGPAVSEGAAIAPDAARWQGWGTALKPANEPIIVARKSLAGTVAANVLEHGTGALNIDGCRTAGDVPRVTQGLSLRPSSYPGPRSTPTSSRPHDLGRWPTNVIFDEDAAADLDQQTGILTSGLYLPEHADNGKTEGTYGAMTGRVREAATYGDSGGASRFFPTFRYEAKAPTVERPEANGVLHPTVKPLDLMRWLVRLVTPPGGLVLDPFAGSGTTAEACVIEGFRCITVEREADYLPLIIARLTKPIQPDIFGAAS